MFDFIKVFKNNYISLLSGMLLALLLTIPLELRALDLNYPSDCANSAQECADQICADGGGTLYIESGEHQLGPANVPGLPPLNNNLFVLCSNFKIQGMDNATLDANGSANALGGPFISMGGLPFSPQTEENIEISNLTISCDDATNCAFAAVGTVFVNGGRIHHLNVSGFSQGFTSITSNDIQLSHNIIYGRGPGQVSFGINFAASGFPPFLPAGDPALTLTSGHRILNNIIVDTSVGINIETVLDSKIKNNFVLRGQAGIRIRGGNDLRIKSNIIADLDREFDGGFFTAGIRLGSGDHNRVVGNFIVNTKGGPAIHFTLSNLNFEIARNPDVFSNGNSNNKTYFNLFLGYNPDVCGPTEEPGIGRKGYCFEPEGDDGALSDGGGNRFFFNVANQH